MGNLQKQQDMMSNVKHYLHKNQEILLAFSGGLDSTVLLHLLTKLRSNGFLRLRALHVHHGLSKQADDWAEHCKQVCQKWHIPLTVAHVNIDKKNNIEAKARQARYDAIKTHLTPNEVVMTAQHLDDQSETFLLALKRGSGPTGLSSMPAISSFANSKLIRPLLAVSREEITHYARTHHLFWIEDESNQDRRYDRNFLRLTALPLLNQRWPRFNHMVARSAALCGEETQLIMELLTDELNPCMDSAANLLITPLLTMSDLKRNALLRTWLKIHGMIMPSRQQLHLLWQTVANARKDANPQFAFHPYTIRRFQQRLYVLKKQPSLSHMMLFWDMKSPLLLPNSLGILYCDNTAKGPLRKPEAHESPTICFQTTGKFSIVGRQGSRSIKKLWQEFSIPPWMRNQIPLLYYNDTLISAIGIFITREGQGNDLAISLKV